MRISERIDGFLEKMTKINLAKTLNEIFELNIDNEHLDLIYRELDHIKKVWKDNPDWRFTQVLVNTRLLPNTPGFWYYQEDFAILRSLGYPPREYIYWGKNYNKDGTQLPKTQYVLMKDLDTDHIKTILTGGWVEKHHPYYEYFENELKLRNE